MGYEHPQQFFTQGGGGRFWVGDGTESSISFLSNLSRKDCWKIGSELLRTDRRKERFNWEKYKVSHGAMYFEQLTQKDLKNMGWELILTSVLGV